MSVNAGHLTVGPLAAARLQTETSEGDEPVHTPRSLRWAWCEILVFAVAATLVALMIAAIAQTMTHFSTQPLAEPTEEVIVIDPDGQEPFIVCTIRATAAGLARSPVASQGRYCGPASPGR